MKLRVKSVLLITVFTLQCLLLLASVVVTVSAVLHFASAGKAEYILLAFLIGGCAFAYSVRNVVKASVGK